MREHKTPAYLKDPELKGHHLVGMAVLVLVGSIVGILLVAGVIYFVIHYW